MIIWWLLAVGQALPERAVVAGAGEGANPVIRAFDATSGAQAAEVMVFDQRFAGGVRVAVADVNGDSRNDVIAGAGPGGGPHLKVLDGTNLVNVLHERLAFREDYRGGVMVAAGDFTRDGKAELVACSGAGSVGGPRVNVFDGADPDRLLATVRPYPGGGQRSASVATGDFNGDGICDLVVSASGADRVKVYNGSGVALGIGLVELIAELQPFADFRGVVYVAAADFNGDGRVDLATAAGSGGSPRVRLLSGVGFAPLADGHAYDQGYLGGVRLAALDADGDGSAELVTCPGAGGGSLVKLFDHEFTQVRSWSAFAAGYAGEVWVGGD